MDFDQNVMTSQNILVIYMKKRMVGGGSDPTPPNFDLKVSEMSALGPPRGCASGSLWVNINIYLQKKV